MLPGSAGPRGPILLSTSDVMVLFSISRRTVKRWAAADGWTRHGPVNRRRWELDHVQASHDARRS